jgi:CBS domain-containing membrane protein
MLAVDATNATLAMGVLGLLAVLVREPMIFPSLGATAYLLFARPHEHQSSFRNAFLGHLVAALIGWLTLKTLVGGFDSQHVMAALEIFRPGSRPSMAHTWPYVAAAAISIGLTLAVLVATGIEHSPACSTTLLFSLGVFQHLWQIAALMAGVVLLLLCGGTLNRIAEFITNPRRVGPDGPESIAGSGPV